MAALFHEDHATGSSAFQGGPQQPSKEHLVFPPWTATTSIYLTGKLRFWDFVVQG